MINLPNMSTFQQSIAVAFDEVNYIIKLILK